MKYLVVVCLLLSCSNKIILESNSRAGAKHKVFFIGDSMTSDDPGNFSLADSSMSKSYGWYLKQMLSDDYEFKNYAVSGVGINEMNNQMQSVLNEGCGKSKVNIVCILGCINNISFSGMKGEDCYNQMKKIHSTLRANGFKTICISLTSRRQLDYFTEEQSIHFWNEVKMADSLFKHNASTFCDYYLDLQTEHIKKRKGRLVGFAGYEAPTQSNYFLDGCHFSDCGKQRIAFLLKKKLRKIK